MATARIPTKLAPAASTGLKAALGFGRGTKRHQRHDGRSLKQRVRAIMVGTDKADEELQSLCKRWLFNKKANASKPPLGVGSTRKRKGDGNKGKAPAADKNAKKR